MPLKPLVPFDHSHLDLFAQNNFMIYNWAMPVEDCQMIIKKFEDVVRFYKTQVDTFLSLIHISEPTRPY